MAENGKQDLGLAILAAGTSFGSWSAWNSSLFTVDTFVDSETKLKSAYTAMKYGLVTSVLMGAGIYLVYGEKGKAAAISSAGTGGLLYYIYDKKLKESPALQQVYAQRPQNNTQKLNHSTNRVQIGGNTDIGNANKLALIDIASHALWFV